jgi:hypothetical protein
MAFKNSNGTVKEGDLGGCTRIGCMDPNAINYDPSACQHQANTCIYCSSSGWLVVDDNGIKPDSLSTTTYQVLIDRGVLTNSKYKLNVKDSSPDLWNYESCCNQIFTGDNSSWDGKRCINSFETTTDEPTITFNPTDLDDDKPTDTTPTTTPTDCNINVNNFICINCDNFTWWDNLYKSNNSGFSIKQTTPNLWDRLVDLINTDGSFYANKFNGDINFDEICCNKLEPSNFDNGICLCEETTTVIIDECFCVDNLTKFTEVVNTISGKEVVLNVEFIQTTFNTTTSEATLIVNNFLSERGIGVVAKTLVSKYLSDGGSFYICKSNNVYNNPSETKCSELSGVYNGFSCNCEERIVNLCDLSFTDVTVNNIKDSFNNDISVVQYNNENISEDCCRIISNNENLNWVYRTGNDGVARCYTKEPKNCLPLKIKLNENPIIPVCETPLKIEVSLLFKTPSNPCQVVEVTPTDDDDIIDPNTDDSCILEFDEENNIIDGSKVNRISSDNISESTNTTTPEITDKCCYNETIPILANISINGGSSITQIKTYDSSIDGFDNWVVLSAELTLEDLKNFDLKVEFTQGLNCCCVYDILIDNVKVNCVTEETVIETIKNDCVGFELTKVIDNKKSWVYNPGVLGYSKKPYDEYIHSSSPDGLIFGRGVINRTFSPSEDSNLPWRFTNYYEQQLIKEKHSDLVLNSKEMFLTFNMSTTILTGDTTTKYTLLDIEQYKKTFQSFWVRFVEQFVPATTIFVSGEKWSNQDDDICVVYNDCDLDFELVEAEVSTIPSISSGFLQFKTTSNSTSIEPTIDNFKETNTIKSDELFTTGDGVIDLEYVKIRPLDNDLGSTTEKQLTYELGDLEERKFRKLEYNNKLFNT